MKRLIMVTVLVGLVTAAAVAATPHPAAAQGSVRVVPPVEGYYERQTLKGYGVLVDAAYHAAHRDVFPNNGHRNQFTGYHAGADVEFYGSADAGRPVAVTAVADGEVVYAGWVAGYGGLIIVRHDAVTGSPEPVTSLYGHVRLADRTVEVGQRVAAGHRLAFLGESFTADTSGARKHLHFGIHQGPHTDFQGYEPTVERLGAGWYNPDDWLARHGVRPSAPPTPAISATPTPEPVAPVSAPAPPPEPPSVFDRIAGVLSRLLG